MAEGVAKEIEAVKRLPMLLLLKLGATSEEIGTGLGVDSSAVRRMIPGKKVKRIQFK